MYQSTIYRPNGKLSAPMRLVTMKPTSVIIMDTHPIIRMSIEVLLQKNSELQIVLKTDDYRITIDYLRTRPVDLIIMDIDLPGTDGFTFLKRIKQIQSTVKVAERYKLVLTVLSVNAMIRMIFFMPFR